MSSGSGLPPGSQTLRIWSRLQLYPETSFTSPMPRFNSGEGVVTWLEVQTTLGASLPNLRPVEYNWPDPEK